MPQRPMAIAPAPPCEDRMCAGPVLFALGAAGGFLGAFLLAGFPRRKRGPSGLPAPTEDSAEEPCAISQACPVPADEDSAACVGRPDPDSMVVFFVQGSPGAGPETAPPAVLSETAPGVETQDAGPGPTGSLPVLLPELSAARAMFSTPFVAGEIVRKGKALRKRRLAPSLGVIVDVFTAYEPVAYNVVFFEGEDARRDLYWEEDLVKLNPMEVDLFMGEYPEGPREEIRKLARRGVTA
jgi:hypothetical protein